ncbi:hypothetical protein Leryth_013082 [Lithospermum erythrorhizon]|nr:hypothetical protein Leryth_013082 [Lithospermum erythrorhizon]
MNSSFILQKRRRWETIQVFVFPLVFFLILWRLKAYEASVAERAKKAEQKATMEMDSDEARPVFMVPDPQFRAVKNDDLAFMDFPAPSCRADGSCPTIILVSGNDQTFAQRVAEKFFPNSSSMQEPIMGTSLYRNRRYSIQSDKCPVKKTVQPKNMEEGNITTECVQVLSLLRKNKAEINDVLFKGFVKSNKDGKINEIMTAFDLGDSSSKSFKVNIWFNETMKTSLSKYEEPSVPPARSLRESLAQSQSLVSNAYIKSLLGDTADIILDFLGEMPQNNDMAFAGMASDWLERILSEVSPIMFWLMFLQLLPIKLKTVVYDKQQRLRIMMKMHGLGDAAYWAISYLYALLISTIYIALVVVCCINLEISTVSKNSRVIVVGFFFIFVNMQISMAFLFSVFFSEVKTVTVVLNTLLVMAAALNLTLVTAMITQQQTPAKWIFFLDLNPWFSFFHGLMVLKEFGEAAMKQGTQGMTLYNFTQSNSGVRGVCTIMLVEWLIFLILAVYLDQVVPSGSGVKKPPLFFLRSATKRGHPEIADFLKSEESKVQNIEIGKDDVAREKETVEHLLRDPQNLKCSAICYNLKKVYPGEDGNPPTLAVKGLSLAFNTGECFGMLGPSGSGKTSFINVMTGLTEPTSGDAYVAGLDLHTQMDEIYNNMGICPQHDLLWDILTGREHLLFYGRLKNLKGKILDDAVEEALKSVKLFDKGVPDKFAGQYSGGMKRRLSVAISLIGNPKIVYLDEPSTGLDPASRITLWGVDIYSMLQFLMTSEPSHDTDVFDFVKQFCPNAERVYHISGTQKFELPKMDIKLSDVFRVVKQAKQMFPIQAWGVSDTSLEDVFIKVATEAQAASLD